MTLSHNDGADIIELAAVRDCPERVAIHQPPDRLCRHRSVVVDDIARILTCRSCGQQIDPITWILEWRSWFETIVARECALRERQQRAIDRAMKRREKREKTAQEAKRRYDPPPINAEAVRRAREHASAELRCALQARSTDGRTSR